GSTPPRFQFCRRQSGGLAATPRSHEASASWLSLYSRNIGRRKSRLFGLLDRSSRGGRSTGGCALTHDEIPASRVATGNVAAGRQGPLTHDDPFAECTGRGSRSVGGSGQGCRGRRT